MVDGRLVIANDPPLITSVKEDEIGAKLRTLFNQYRHSLRGAQRDVLERFQIVDVATKVVGVGSVGTRCFIVLLIGRGTDDPLFLQGKEAEASVLAAHLPRSIYTASRQAGGSRPGAHAGSLGYLPGLEQWTNGRYFYWRQLRDMKGSVEIETLCATDLAAYGELCGWALARAHAHACGSAVEIAAYLGTCESFDRAIATFAEAYANQTERDYQAFLAAIKSGRIKAASVG